MEMLAPHHRETLQKVRARVRVKVRVHRETLQKARPLAHAAYVHMHMHMGHALFPA